jgi:nicotinic acid mononucleotide adenylyltransferase
VDEVLCVVPSIFPHKEYFGATLEQRLDMLAEAETLALTSIASSEKGLFIDIAREAREHYGAETRIYFVCGRDAAERILSWDYGRPGVVEEMLQEFELLVAARDGEFRPPVEFQHRIHPLGLRGAHDQVSSTEVRDRIARGEPWEHLVPKEIADRVREIYS